MVDEKIARYGIYFCPSSESALYRFGNTWLGRDAITSGDLDPDLPAAVHREDWVGATTSPRRYAFHATLKPPFRLAEGTTFEDLRDSLHSFCDRHSCFEAGPLEVSRLGHFIALTLAQPSPPFQQLASDCVSEFDRFRAPANEAELANRLNGSLSAREHEHVLRWGYPYVLDTWKFHMTLTSSLRSDELQSYFPYLQARFAPVCIQPLHVESICIYREPHPGAPFCLIERAQLRCK